ncbi:MAG: antitoxin [Corynebacterium sp.]|uniref:antitoxin n=1 Tax=Corynebacterium sp. TaxID=1720 RepID=UPI0026DBBE81|nr:antitoxin [Corynebacterium sp.]MDO5030827.1 antitoxin [Corynebacterium sp.]
MGLMDKAKDMLNDEETTDKVLDKAEQLGKDKLGEDKADQIKKARDMADERIGDNQQPEK